MKLRGCSIMCGLATRTGVLLAEGDHELGQAVVAGLRADGFAVDWAAHVPEANLKQSLHAYDWVVLDRGLPDCGGLDLLRRWRRRLHASSGLVLTALDTLQDRIAGFADRADDYLGKPFAMEELVMRVGALCRRREPPQETVLHALEVEMDPSPAARVPRRCPVVLGQQGAHRARGVAHLSGPRGVTVGAHRALLG
jgi:DNA-binding response OmpR family regulator